MSLQHVCTVWFTEKYFETTSKTGTYINIVSIKFQVIHQRQSMLGKGKVIWPLVVVGLETQLCRRWQNLVGFRKWVTLESAGPIWNISDCLDALTVNLNVREKWVIIGMFFSKKKCWGTVVLAAWMLLSFPQQSTCKNLMSP